MREINVTIYNEFVHEQEDPEIAKVYPKGIHQAIADAVGEVPEIGTIKTATLDDHKKVLTEECLADTDVLLWWGHIRHDEVDDEVVERIYKRVNEGMGLIVLHSGHYSKIFKKLMGTTCDIRWRESGDRCMVWTVAKGHPIVEGLGECFSIAEEESYGEQFDIPEPDELILINWYSGGEVLRSGCTYRRGAGKIFYYANGHETYPIYYQPEVKKILQNATRWAAPYQTSIVYDLGGMNAKSKL